jgi:hypothetical protein
MLSQPALQFIRIRLLRHGCLPPGARVTLHPGAFVRLVSQQDGTYQVLSIDEDSGSCWIRRWPLTRHGSPAFAASLEQLAREDRQAA